MKILVIGASHGVGKCLVHQALEQGHEITAYTRNPNPLAPYHERLSIYIGDIIDKDAVNTVIKDQEAVCITIGTKPTTKPVTVFSEGTKYVIEAMQKKGLKSLICVTGIGAGDSKDCGGFQYDKIFNPLLLKTIYEDKDRQEEIIRQSDLDWVIVRPGFLNNGPLTGDYRVLTDLQGIKVDNISREDTAHFILKEILEKKYIHKTPLITY